MAPSKIHQGKCCLTSECRPKEGWNVLGWAGSLVFFLPILLIIFWDTQDSKSGSWSLPLATQAKKLQSLPF